VTGEIVTTSVAFLTCKENIVEKFSVVLDFLLGVIAFHDILFHD
jgi:hypothetical protein